MVSSRCLSLAQHFLEIDNARMKPAMDNTTATARAALRAIRSLYPRATGSSDSILSGVDDRDPAHILGAKHYAADTIAALPGDAAPYIAAARARCAVDRAVEDAIIANYHNLDRARSAASRAAADVVSRGVPSFNFDDDHFSEDPYTLLMALAHPPNPLGYNQYMLPPDRPDVVPSKGRDGNDINESV